LLFPPKGLEKPGRKLRCCCTGAEAFVNKLTQDGTLAHVWCNLNTHLHKSKCIITYTENNLQY